MNTELNVIETDKELKTHIGHPRLVIKADKFVLQVEVRNSIQGEKL